MARQDRLTLQIRIPREIHARLVAEAKDRVPSVSLNHEIIERLAISLRKGDFYAEAFDKLERGLRAEVEAAIEKMRGGK
jgi:hypothetical protein